MRWLPLLAAAVLAAAEVRVADPWARATMAGAETGAVYATIAGGDADDRLLAAESAASAVVEVHEHVRGADGVMAMREVAGGIPVPAGASVVLRPGSYHIMLIGLRAPLAKGARVPVTLVFARAGRIAIAAEVLDPWAMAHDER